MKPSGNNKPHLIITVGIPGSGKSFFAEHFAETFKAPIVSYERLQSPTNSIDDSIVGSNLKYMLGEVLKTGQTIVYDGLSNTRVQRTDITKLAKQSGYEPLFVWLQTDESTARKRATKIDDKHPVAITEDDFNRQLNRFSPPNKSDKAIVVSGKHNYASQLKIVLRNLASISSNEATHTPNHIQQTRRNIVLR